MEILSIASQKKFTFTQSRQLAFGQLHSVEDCAMAFSMAAEIERDLISQRTKRRWQPEKKDGVILGRPKGSGKSKLDTYRPEIEPC